MTCQRARVALTESGQHFEAIDIFRKPLSVDDLVELAAGRPAAELFSWRSPQAKKRGITPGSRSDRELLELMAEEPRLIRRPLVRVGKELIVGADAKRITELLSGSS